MFLAILVLRFPSYCSDNAMCSACAGDDVRAEKYRCRGEKQASRWDVTVPRRGLFVCTLVTLSFEVNYAAFSDSSIFHVWESIASAEGEQRLARAKLKRAWNLLCRTETRPRTIEKPKTDSRETLCIVLSSCFKLAIQLYEVPRSLLWIGIKQLNIVLANCGSISIPPNLNTRDMTSLWNSGAHGVEVRLRNCGGTSAGKWPRRAERAMKGNAMRLPMILLCMHDY